jgi:hypothetical protein
MNRRNKTIAWRNKEIYAEYIAHLRNGQPVMLAYTIIAEKFDLSENHVRNIIMDRAKNH